MNSVNQSCIFISKQYLILWELFIDNVRVFFVQTRYFRLGFWGQRLWNSQSLISLPKIVFLIFIFVLCKFMKPELMSIIRVKKNREKEGGNA